MTDQELELWHARFAAASMERMMRAIDAALAASVVRQEPARRPSRLVEAA